MIQAYNFLFSWQLFPEKGIYEQGERPKSGTYKINTDADDRTLSFDMNWVTLENTAYSSTYQIHADGDLHELQNNEIAEKASITFIDSISFSVTFYKNDLQVLNVLHEIMPNGYMRITEEGCKINGEFYKNQMFFFHI